MRQRLSILILILLAASPLAARRERPTATATIEWAHQPQRHVIVRSRLWPCRENQCSGIIVPDDPAGRQRTCRAIALRGHRVIAFATASGQLDEAELAACNRGVD